jgi:F0F1-type ATP synthase delta subunit
VIPALNNLLDKIKRHQKKTTATVLTATKLHEKQIDEIKKVLSSKLEKSVEVTVDVDEALIGGSFIRVDGYYIDQTVKKRLRDMVAHMKEGCNA